MANDSDDLRQRDTASRDVASAVKARRTATKPKSVTAGELQEEAAPRLSTADMGVTSTSIGAATLTGSFIAGQTASADYVIASDDAYESFYPRGAHQPTCIKLWSRGQQVHKAYYAEHGGAKAAAKPSDAAPVNKPGGGLHEAAGLQTDVKAPA